MHKGLFRNSGKGQLRNGLLTEYAVNFAAVKLPFSVNDLMVSLYKYVYSWGKERELTLTALSITSHTYLWI